VTGPRVEQREDQQFRRSPFELTVERAGVDICHEQIVCRQTSGVNWITCYVLRVLRCNVLKTCDVRRARATCHVRRATCDVLERDVLERDVLERDVQGTWHIALSTSHMARARGTSHVLEHVAP